MQQDRKEHKEMLEKQTQESNRMHEAAMQEMKNNLERERREQMEERKQARAEMNMMQGHIHKMEASRAQEHQELMKVTSELARVSVTKERERDSRT